MYPRWEVLPGWRRRDSVPKDSAATPLRASDFCFFGFDDLRPILDQELGKIAIRAGDPVASIVEDAIFVPPVETSERGRFEGALLTRDGGPIPAAQSQRRFGAFGEQLIGSLSSPVELEPQRTVDEEVVYLGWYIGHFGHFLLESLARVWVLNQITPSTKVVFHVERERDLGGTTLHILEAFGVPRERILLLDTQTLLRRVVVPEPLYEISHAAHERMALPFQRVAASIVGTADLFDQPVYLSRRLLPSTKRTIVGEFEMEEMFRENGFLVAHPETMTFEDQVRLVNRHRDIFTSSGSAAYLSLFSIHPPRLHFLTSGIPILDYFLVPKAAGAEAHYSSCFKRKEWAELWYLPALVEIDRLAEYLRSFGMLRTPLRASLAARTGVIEPRYADALLYTYVRHSIIRGDLPAAIEADALRRASSSWPLSWVFACKYAFHDPARTDPMVQQFIRLVSRESDPHRLAHFYQDVEGRAKRIAAVCSPEVASQLGAVLHDRFGLDPSTLRIDPARVRKRQERRRARQALRISRPTGDTTP